MHKIDADLFNQDLYLINNVEIDIEITPNDSEFMVIIPEQNIIPAVPANAADGIVAQAERREANTNQYVLEIVSCRLFVKTIDLMDGLSLDVARKLDTQPARYGIRKTMLKHWMINQGTSEYTNALFTDEVPRRIIVGLMDNAAYKGSRFKSPFNFNHLNVREISITANGRCYPHVPYSFDYRNNNYVRAYHDFHEFVGQAYSTESNGIDYAMYKTGWCLYSFILTNSMENENSFELLKDGVTGINIKFADPVANGGYSLIVYAETDSLLLVDRNRQITSDMTV
jgi:hypothetical protein